MRAQDHALRLACVGDASPEDAAGLPLGYRVVEFAESGKAFGLPGARLVPLSGYAERVLSGPAGEPAAGVRGEEEAPAVSLWRCEIWTEGLFSLLFWALGWLEAEATSTPGPGQRPRHLVIDWTDGRILFHGGGGTDACANLWNAFFEQPSEGAPGLGLTAAALEVAARKGRLSAVVRFGPPWFKKLGEFRGADEGGGGFRELRGGRLTQEAAEAGRATVRRWIRLRGGMAAKAARAQEAALGSVAPSRLLAVHLRQTDKLEQCQANRISREEAAAQIVAFCGALGLGGVFLCTDDVLLKDALRADLQTSGLLVKVHAAVLSRSGPSHKDEDLDRRRNAEDVLAEVLIMAECAALLSTYSNVSVGAVYFAPPGYRYFMFGDAPPPRSEKEQAGPPPARRCGGCGAEDPVLCCSRCRAAHFCNQGCQRLAWPRHKLECKPWEGGAGARGSEDGGV